MQYLIFFRDLTFLLKTKLEHCHLQEKVNFRNNNRKTVKFKDLIVREWSNIN